MNKYFQVWIYQAEHVSVIPSKSDMNASGLLIHKTS